VGEHEPFVGVVLGGFVFGGGVFLHVQRGGGQTELTWVENLQKRGDT